MARLLILSSDVPQDVADGWHLRVFNLCRHIAQRHELCLLLFPSRQKSEPYAPPEWFEDFAVFPETPALEISKGRKWRTTDAGYLRRWYPDYFASARRHLEEVTRTREIDVIVNVGGRIAEIPPTLDTPSIIDITDSRTLTLERRLANKEARRLMRAQLELRLKKWRISKREIELVRSYDVVTTISAADRQRMVDISGQDDDRVQIVPNGVAEDALASIQSDREVGRSVVFWGNLNFAPNQTAIVYFLEKIFLPYLAKRGVEWHIAGGGGGELVARLAETPGVFVHGYVDDLYQFLSNKGLMVNPMVEGSGMKNKVLEAFATGLPVVSTTMGIEAINATDGKHYRRADSPKDFADRVSELLDNRDQGKKLSRNARQLVEQEYTWDAAGRRFNSAIERAMLGPTLIDRATGTH